MKRIFNNNGMTFVEVIAAAIILGVIAAPLLTVLLQTSKLNIGSDVELRMNTKVQQIVEEVKAEGKINSEYSTTGVYFDKLFNPTTDPQKYYYKLTVNDPANPLMSTNQKYMNQIDTTSQYDRWDYKITLKKHVDSVDPITHENIYNSAYSDIMVYKNSGAYISQYASFQGKLYAESLLYPGASDTPTPIDKLPLRLFGRIDSLNKYNFFYGQLDASSNPIYDPFIPVNGQGAVSAWDTTDSSNPSDNIVIINIFRDQGLPKFTFDVDNMSFYTDYDDTTPDSSTFDVDRNGNLKFSKHIILNIFGDDPSNQQVAVKSNAPYIDVYRWSTPPREIKNGQRIWVLIDDIKMTPNKTIKAIESVIGKELE